MTWVIPFICAALYRLGGVGRNGRFLPFLPEGCPIASKWWRWLGIGLFLALFRGNLWYILTYFIATNVFSYGENHPITQLFGKFNWFISGFMLGLASFSWINAIFCGIVFYCLMYLSNIGLPKREQWYKNEHWYLDHGYVEIGIGFLGTLIYLWR